MAQVFYFHPFQAYQPKGFIALVPFQSRSPTLGAWEPSTSDGNYQLSLDHLSAKTSGKSGGGNIILRANMSSASGYLEIVIAAVGASQIVGLTSSSQSTSDYVGDTNGVGYQSTGSVLRGGSVIATYSTYTTADVMGVCRKGNFLYFSKNGVWQNSADPSAGTGGIDVSAFASDVLLPATSTSDSASNITGRFTAASMAYPIPSGVTAWDGTSAAVVSSTGTGASTEDTDTTEAAGTVAVSGSGASTEAADTSAASGMANVTATGASTETSYTTSASGTASISASGASTEGTDTTAGTGTLSVSGSAASTESPDTGSGTGTVSIAAAGASTEGTDTTAAAGAVSIAGSGADTEATDTASGAGAAPVAASGASTEGTDNCSGSGTVAQAGSTGTGASTESDDASAGVALTLVAGTGSALEAADTCSGTGTVLSIAFGHIKLWMGTGFIAKPVKVWNGSAWVEKPLKYWTGSIWRATGY